MFRKTIIVMGALVFATFATCGAASARIQNGARSLHGVRSHFGRTHAASTHRIATHGHRYGCRLASLRGRHAGAFRTLRHSARIGSRYRAYRSASAANDTTIQRYVGPRSGYVRTTYGASAGGGMQTGRASFYGGGRTAAGGHVGFATCAHRTLPFGTRVLVTNLANARTAVLVVNDRGPFVRGRIVDVSVGAAGTLGMLHSGTAPVSVQVIGGPG